MVWLPWLSLMSQSSQEPPRSVASLEQQVQQFLQEQKPQFAIPLLREVIPLDPQNAAGNAAIAKLSPPVPGAAGPGGPQALAKKMATA